MLRNYMKISWRILLKNKGYSFINIFGLAAGMATCLLILLYIVDESSYDKHHRDSDRSYRIASEVKGEKWVAAPAPVAEGLKKDFPEVEQAVRLLRFPGTDKVLLKYEQNQKQFFETNLYYVDSAFFQVFSYDFKFGDITTALDGPNSVVISEAVAAKFFINENPIGKVLKVGLSNGEFNYTVKGVFKKSGNKSHIPANVFLSMNNQDIGKWVDSQTSWASNNIFHTYVKLTQGTNPKLFESKLNDFLERNGGEEFKAAGFEKELFIQPVEDIYLHSNYGYEVASNGNIKYLYIFSSIAAFILIIACINFMNLSTARSEKRAKEVGMRKVIGAAKNSLVTQFLGESLMMCGLALIFTVIIIQLLLPVFNQLTNKDLSIVNSPVMLIMLIAIAVLTGLFAGLYPAFYLSSFKPISILKGRAKNGLSVVNIRKGFVVFQFTISTLLILGAIFINQQLAYMSNLSMGFEKDQKIVLPIQTSEANTNSNVLRNKLLESSQIVSAAKGVAYPGIESVTSMLFRAEGKSAHENVEIRTIYTEPGYLETLGIELIAGREFAQEFKHDENTLILNESALQKLGYAMDDAIGKKVYFDWQNTTQSMTIIGVVKDYHFQSLHEKIKPLGLSVHPLFYGPTNYLILDVKSSDYSGLIAFIQNTWDQINPGSPFGYSFLDQDFQRNYEKEELTLQLVQYFTLIAIVIACLGLFGLTTFTAEQRISEIGVRKVLGASISQIVTLLSKDFLKLVVISIVLSSPIAYYIINEWLSGFAYRIDVKWWVFLIAGAMAVVIALFTVSFQAVKAALTNPVESLRTE